MSPCGRTRFVGWLPLAVAAAVWFGGEASSAGQALSAQENETAARLHFDRGSKLYDQGKYLDAAREFEAGYESAPRPLFLLNIGHSYRRAQDLRKAKAVYEKLLRTDPTTIHRPIVEDLIKTIDDALSVQELDLRSPDKKASARIPSPPSYRAAGGSEPVDRSLPNFVSTPASSARPTPPPSESSWLRNPWFWGIVAGVVTAGAAGTAFALTRNPACPANTCWKEP